VCLTSLRRTSPRLRDATADCWHPLAYSIAIGALLLPQKHTVDTVAVSCHLRMVSLSCHPQPPASRCDVGLVMVHAFLPAFLSYRPQHGCLSREQRSASGSIPQLSNSCVRTAVVIVVVVDAREQHIHSSASPPSPSSISGAGAAVRRPKTLVRPT
jgi:hypothetical protein